MRANAHGLSLTTVVGNKTQEPHELFKGWKRAEAAIGEGEPICIVTDANRVELLNKLGVIAVCANGEWSHSHAECLGRSYLVLLFVPYRQRLKIGRLCDGIVLQIARNEEEEKLCFDDVFHQKNPRFDEFITNAESYYWQCDEEQQKSKVFNLTSWPEGSPRSREWVYEGLLQNKNVTLISAKGGSGKTTYTLQLATCYVMGVEFMGKPFKGVPQNVLMINGEDGIDEFNLRLMAICDFYGFEFKSVKEKIKVLSIPEMENDLKFIKHESGEYILTDEVAKVIDTAKHCNAGLIIIDPVKSLHGFEETVPVNELIGRAATKMAKSVGCPVLLCSHVNKVASSDNAADQNATRGGSSLVDKVRLALNLFPMSERQAKKLNIHEQDCFQYIQVTKAKANNTARGELQWLKICPKDYELGDGVETLITLRPIDLTQAKTVKTIEQEKAESLDVKEQVFEIMCAAGEPCTEKHVVDKLVIGKLSESTRRRRLIEIFSDGHIDFEGMKIIRHECFQGKKKTVQYELVN